MTNSTNQQKTYSQTHIRVAFWLGIAMGMTVGFLCVVGIGVIATAVL